MRWRALDYFASCNGSLARFCAHGNEPSGSIKGREFL
jgi:hypothetical protein